MKAPLTKIKTGKNAAPAREGRFLFRKRRRSRRDKRPARGPVWAQQGKMAPQSSRPACPPDPSGEAAIYVLTYGSRHDRITKANVTSCMCRHK